MNLTDKQEAVLAYLVQGGTASQRAITRAFVAWPGPSVRVLMRHGLVEAEHVDLGPFSSFYRYSATDAGREALR